MTMNPLYPRGKPCSIGTHNQTARNQTLFLAIVHGVMMELRLRISNPVMSPSIEFESKVSLYLPSP